MDGNSIRSLTFVLFAFLSAPLFGMEQTTKDLSLQECKKSRAKHAESRIHEEAEAVATEMTREYPKNGWLAKLGLGTTDDWAEVKRINTNRAMTALINTVCGGKFWLTHPVDTSKFSPLALQALKQVCDSTPAWNGVRDAVFGKNTYVGINK